MFQKHLARLKYSLEQIDINFDKFHQLETIIYQLAELNSLNSEFSAYIQITRGISFPRTHSYSKNLKPTVFIYISKLNNRDNEINNGVRVILQQDFRWSRCDIKSIALLPNVLANSKAINQGDYEAVFFRDNKITEGSHTNFFAVKNDKIITAPLSNFILNGVTRNIILDLCKQKNIPFNEEYILVNKIFDYDEFFLTSTTTEITPVVKVNKNLIGDGKPGKLTREIQNLFYEFVKNY